MSIKTMGLIAGMLAGTLAVGDRASAQIAVVGGGYTYSPGVVTTSYYMPAPSVSYYSSPAYYSTPYVGSYYTSGYYGYPYATGAYYSPSYYGAYPYYGGGAYIGGPRRWWWR